MTRLPDEEQIKKEIRNLLAVNPQLMRCITCRHYGKLTSFCDEYNRITFPYVPACNSYDSNDEMMLREVISDLAETERECKLSDLLINLQPTTSLAATLFGEHHISVLKSMMEREKDASNKRQLKKDIATIVEMTNAAKRMTKALNNIKDKWYKCLCSFMDDIESDINDVDAQYRQYIQRYVDKTFCKKGEYNEKLYTQFLSNAGDFCSAILDKVKKSYDDEGDICPMREKDYNRYKIRK